MYTYQYTILKTSTREKIQEALELIWDEYKVYYSPYACDTNRSYQSEIVLLGTTDKHYITMSVNPDKKTVYWCGERLDSN